MFRLFAFSCCLCLSANLLGQEGIQTKNELGVEDLVKTIFIKGNCKNVSNITAIGNEIISIGQFDNGESIFNFKDGIILSTGAIELAPGPNADNESGFAFNTESNDADLSQSATGNLFDVTGIEFDFVPLADNVSFRYVFASEEYCEFVGTQFNDVFGFFVSGPGINGPFDNNAINVASIVTLNGTEEIVSINTINHLENETFYVSNITTTDAQNCEISYSPVYQDLIEYDGFTISLTASFQVIPCETYHIRLVLGDVGDAILDSAVFLESNSFDLGEKAQIRAEVPGSDEAIAYEGCVDGQFVFTRSPSSNINEDCTIEYTISPESEAINGVDFEEIPLSITIPAGDTIFILPITVIEDNIAEGPENLKLEFVYNCDCIDPVFSELIINETNDLSVNFEEILVCEDEVFSLVPDVIGGVPPFDFLWETGSTSEALETSITTPTQFTLTVTDFCGITSLGIADVGIQNRPSATLFGGYDLCETITTGIPIQLEGNPPWTIEYNINGVEQPAIENILVNPFFLNTTLEGTYELIAFNDAYCEGNVLGSALVEYSTFDISTTLVPPSCIYSSDGSIEITQLDAIPPFSVEWNVDTQNDFLIENLQEDTYTLSIIDGNGCIYEENFDLNASSDNINDCLPIYIPNSFSPNDDGINDVFSIYAAPLNGIEKIVSFQIFDRWGSLIFEQNNFLPDNVTSGWKGDHKGNPLNTGVFVFKVLIAFEDDTTLLISGDVTLLR